MKKYYSLILLLALAFGATSCKDFVIGKVEAEPLDNTLFRYSVPMTIADEYKAPVVTEEIPNHDPNGALNEWATCLILFKEGHAHGGDKFHGNHVYPTAPWRQEQLVVVHNTPQGIKVEVQKESTLTHLEKALGKEGKEYVRIIGGQSKLYGLIFYFFDKQGNLISDRILEQSSRYQLFLSVSDLDSDGKPYEILDLRERMIEDGDQLKIVSEPIPSKDLKEKTTLEQRRKITPSIFRYTYRDTWTFHEMGDGVRSLFNLKLNAPLGREDLYTASSWDKDHVGIKGFLSFAASYHDDTKWDPAAWHRKLSNGDNYEHLRGETTLHPAFYLAVQVMKCEEGKKVVVPVQTNNGEGENGEPVRKKCAPAHAPAAESEWKEVVRFNIPIHVFTIWENSDPTRPNPMEPYYVQLANELGIKPEEAFEAAENIQIHGGGGFNWFL